MKIFQINGGVFGSTGKIMFGIAEAAQDQGHEVLCAAPVTSTNRNRQPDHPYIKIGSYYGRCLNVLLARVTGMEGCFSLLPTLKLLRRIRRFSPDVIHLHSIHNSYLNIPLLFRYIKRHPVRVVWTLHDCWAVTGHCPHFDMVGCDRWKTQCCGCPQYREYPKAYRDNSRFMHRWKKKWFSGVEDLTIVTPSRWLAGIVEQSFLKDYPVKVIPNGIDLSVFRPRESDFRRRYGCEEKIIVLGVAFGWNEAKGLDVFQELSRRLDDRYQIVLVGTDAEVEKQLPKNIIAVRRTQNQQGLAEIYTAADVFVNPTRQETLGLVNVEAIACGTPVITFRTGGSPETVNGACGAVVEKNDIDGLTELLLNALEKKPGKEDCMLAARVFDAGYCYKEIVKLYEKNNTAN